METHADIAEIAAAPRACAVPKRADAAEVQSGRKLRLLTLADLDGRTRAHREVVRLIDAVVDDLGGPDVVTAAQREIVESGCLLAVMGKDLGARWLAGGSVDCTMAATLANAMRRQFETAGIARYREPARSVAVDVEPAPDVPAEAAADAVGAPAPEGPADIAARLKQILGPLSATAAPAKPKPPPPLPEVGDFEVIGERVRMTLVEVMADDRQRWMLTDSFDPGRGALEFWIGRDTARQRAEILLTKLPTFRPFASGDAQ
jgi:hypothetical protein